MNLRLGEAGIVEFQPPVRQWRMTEVHELQHGASYPSLRTGAVSEKFLYESHSFLCLQAGRDGCNPSLDAGVGLVVLVDVVEGQADKLAVNHGLGIIEGVVVGFYAANELSAAILNTIIQFAYAAYEGIAIG